MALDNGPNRAQVEYWNEQTGSKWVEKQAELDRLLLSLGTAAIDRLAVRPGERIIDVGCGCGDTTLELARRAGPDGRVVGIDLSAPMLARARERARGASNVDFVQGDAQTHRFESTFDALFSRFGVMFFIDPPAAFTNLRRALRPGGRLAFVCWQPLSKNAWGMVPIAAIAKHVPLPAPPPPDEPGPFAFGDAERVRRILREAGFEGVAIDPHEEPLTLGVGSVDEAVAFVSETGPTARLIKDLSPEIKEEVLASVRGALAPFASPAGYQLGSASWMVTARIPA
jgi:SAM-dependent methyltransferase